MFDIIHVYTACAIAEIQYPSLAYNIITIHFDGEKIKLGWLYLGHAV